MHFQSPSERYAFLHAQQPLEWGAVDDEACQVFLTTGSGNCGDRVPASQADAKDAHAQHGCV